MSFMLKAVLKCMKQVWVYTNAKSGINIPKYFLGFRDLA